MSTEIFGQSLSGEIETLPEEQEEQEYPICPKCGDPIYPGSDNVGGTHYWCYSHPEEFQVVDNTQEVTQYNQDGSRRSSGKTPIPTRVSSPSVGGNGVKGRARKYDYPEGLDANERRNYRRRMDRATRNGSIIKPLKGGRVTTPLREEEVVIPVVEVTPPIPLIRRLFPWLRQNPRG